MGLRGRIRKLRLYYQSFKLFREVLRNPARTLFLPIVGHGEFVSKNGVRFRVPKGCWFLLPNFCRLASMEAVPKVENGRKKVTLRNLTFYSPLEAKNEGIFYREVFIDDVYGIREKDLSGKTVVDVGAYVGDSAIAFAERGATVYAFEPSAAVCSFLEENVAINPVPGKVIIQKFGLSDKEHALITSNDRMHFVEGVNFILKNLPEDIDTLKMDCEECEYYLFRDARFLSHLNPQTIVMEYHRGGQELSDILCKSGYSVRWDPNQYPVGYMYAKKK
ncbi:MAG: FkbM family methyltransferase [Gammaproteobacteria bacterium]|nr:FkbM family methyltransferase [Gammaproteobacteria bacterium]